MRKAIQATTQRLVRVGSQRTSTSRVCYQRMATSASGFHGPYGGSAGFSVPYEVRPSTLGGSGLFATRKIPQGTLIWEASEDNCNYYKTEQEVREHLDKLTHEEVLDFLEHAYCGEFGVIDILDDGRYWNHSKTPNTGGPPAGEEDTAPVEATWAVRDIQEGEELLDNYIAYEIFDWYERICDEYDTESLAIIGEKFD